jgi:alcohol dehydrogenase (cytochrome c)
MANRNAFYYLLDRTTGEFLIGAPFARQTWAKGLDTRGRPIVVPGQEPSLYGTLTYPSVIGATNWFSPSFSHTTGLFYVEVREMGSYYYKGESKYKPGVFWQGGGEAIVDQDKAYGAIRALELATGKMRWEFRLLSGGFAGVLSTAGGLVFGGSAEGNVYALDARSGRPLWDFQAGGPVEAAPISFLIDGKQHLAVSVNRAIFVFGL